MARTPFVDEKGQTDIAFATDDGVVYLSELEDSGVINKCGWFSRLFRKIAKIAAIVAAVAVVVAVAVAAAPVAAATGTAFATAAASGRVAALAGGSAATAMAVAAGTAVASTAFVVASTTALVAGFSAISAYLASKTFANMEEKVQAAVTELSKTKDGDKGVKLFRGAKKGAPYKSFMPCQNKRDDNGLSFFSSYTSLAVAIKGVAEYGVYITTTQAIESTGTLYYRRDFSQHYSVFLQDGTTLAWTETHANLLVNISFFVPGLKQ